MKRGTSEENDNPDAEDEEGLKQIFATFIPTNTTNIVKVTQVMSLLIYALFPGDSVQDLAKSFRYYPKSDLNDYEPTRCIKLSCILRFIQGVMAVLAALILVLTSRTVMDIILNFTALNSISGIDDTTFALAEAGVFGPEFKKETDYVKNKDLPVRVYRKTKHVIYWKVMASIFVCFVAVLCFVMAAQHSTNIWITTTFRVQFQETQFKEYSGCFHIDARSNSFHRYTYGSMSKTKNNTSFGYCRDERFWVFWENDPDNVTSNACDVIDPIAHSMKTNDHDISTSFDFPWLFPISNTPFDLFFFDSLEEDELSCNRSLEDGKCDTAFNERSYNYDGGDCCAPTCHKPLCGKDGLSRVFDVDEGGDGFQDCQNPNMLPVTIHINNMSSPREQHIANVDQSWFINNLVNETKWRTEPPIPPLCNLVCNGQEVLTVYITQSMLKNSHSVKIEDGASCELTVLSTGGEYKVVEGANADFADPIWYINYTIFHVENIDAEDQIQILTQSSSEVSTVNFHRIPTCYIEKLRSHVDVPSIYTGSSPSNDAIRWLMEDPTDNSVCQENTFIERYVLANMLIDMKGSEPLLSYDNQCSWSSVTCLRGQATHLALRSKDLQGRLPSEIGLLNELKELDIANNNISSITSRLGLLTNLQDIYIADNMVASLPSEIGLLSNLKHLSFSSNNIEIIPDELGSLENIFGIYGNKNAISSIPTSIGLMASLGEFYVAFNNISSLPTEIGLLKNMLKIQFDGNILTSLVTEMGLMESLLQFSATSNQISIIPTEIGMMKGLLTLKLGENQISRIPTEIGSLTNLSEIIISNNKISRIPTEIGSLSEKLQKLWIFGNNLTSFPNELYMLSNLRDLYYGANDIPIMATELGLLTSLQYLQFSDTLVSTIPSEIGLLTNLKEFYSSRNKVSSIPSEFGSLTSMRYLYFSDNSITSVTSEIGLMTSLELLILNGNGISSIPSEIGLLTNLEKFSIYGNKLTNDDIPDDVKELCFSDTLNCDFGFDLRNRRE